MEFLTSALVLGVLIIIFLTSAIKIVSEYERGVIFRLGRLVGAKGPGLFFMIPIVDRMVKVDLRTITMDVPHRRSSPKTTFRRRSTLSSTSESWMLPARLWKWRTT